MNLVERLFALRASPSFAQLREAELVLIADAARPRRYAPGEQVAPAGRPLRHLYVLVEGRAVVQGGEELEGAFGAVSLLLGAPVELPIHAGPEGATCLLIRRAHFHTILSECPGLVLGLLRSQRHAESGRAA